jgi:tyrosine-protein phosphatase SIW14
MKVLPIHRTLVTLLAFGVVALAADAPGVGNFHQVNDHLYRGAQPSTQGFESLAKLGVKTVIDLREPGSRSNNEKAVVEKAGMRYVNIPFSGYSAPTEQQMVQVLALFDNPESGPVFIHCRRGADRTGTVIACYRVLHDHWKNADALAEAKGNGMSWTERSMQHYVLAYKVPAAAPAAAIAAAVN